MKKIIKNHEVFGELLYKKTYWKRIEPLKVYFNNKEVSIPLNISIYDTLFVEFEMGLSELDQSFFTEEHKLENDKYDLQVIDRYKQYIENFSETIKDIEKLLINDYAKYRQEWSDEEIIRCNGETKGKKLINAVKDEKKILALIKFKSMMIHNDRIVVSIKCPWYPWDDGGILLEEGGYMKIGNGDMMQ